jgi:hypothetical protein
VVSALVAARNSVWGMIELSSVLGGAIALAWLVVYIDAIRVAVRDELVAVPPIGVLLNVAWDWLFGISSLLNGNTLHAWGFLSWAVVNIGVLVTLLRYGRRELPAWVGPIMYGVWVACGLCAALATLTVTSAIIGFSQERALIYTALIDGVLLSALFIALFVHRNGARGQSAVIAAAKLVGSIAAMTLFGVLPVSIPATTLGAITVTLDLTYLCLVLLADRLQPACS